MRVSNKNVNNYFGLLGAVNSEYVIEKFWRLRRLKLVKKDTKGFVLLTV